MMVKTLLSAVLATVFFACAAQAGEDRGYAPAALNKWKHEASRIVSYTMRYPTPVGRLELRDDFNVVTAVVDREGKVLEAELTEPSGNRFFDRASRNFARQLKSLPPLPDSVETDGAVVRMHLIYAATENGVGKLQRRIVRMRQIAESEPETVETGVASSGKMVIDLFTGGA